MIGRIVDNIMMQLDQHHNAYDLKKVLLFRLEQGIGERGIVRDLPRPEPMPEVHDFTGEPENANV